MTSRSRPLVELSATCACGKVSISVKGKVLAMFMCSCEHCQKATGTGHSAVAVFRGDDVTIAGETRGFSQVANSGASFSRNFCPSCGTPIWARSSRWPDATILPVGLFGASTDWFVPNQLIFSRSHRDWDFLPDDLPRHQTYRDEEPA